MDLAIAAAIILAVIASFAFLFDFMRSGYASFMDVGLMLFSVAFACLAYAIFEGLPNG